MYALPWVEDDSHRDNTPGQRRWNAALADGTSIQATYRTGVTPPIESGVTLAYGIWRARIIHPTGTSRMIDYSDSPDEEWCARDVDGEMATRGMVLVADPSTVNDHVWDLTVGKRLEDAGIAADNARAHRMLGEAVLTGQQVVSDKRAAAILRLCPA